MAELVDFVAGHRLVLGFTLDGSGRELPGGG